MIALGLINSLYYCKIITHKPFTQVLQKLSFYHTYFLFTLYSNSWIPSQWIKINDGKKVMKIRFYAHLKYITYNYIEEE